MKCKCIKSIFLFNIIRCLGHTSLPNGKKILTCSWCHNLLVGGAEVLWRPVSPAILPPNYRTLRRCGQMDLIVIPVLLNTLFIGVLNSFLKYFNMNSFIFFNFIYFSECLFLSLIQVQIQVAKNVINMFSHLLAENFRYFYKY